MKWTRERPGRYHAGPYTVTEVDQGWAATGPGLDTREDVLWDTKAAAQRKAESQASRRASDPAVEPVVGDAVEYAGIRCRITAIMATASGAPLYCMVKPRGKRQCLLRSEFKVVIQ